ncbi:MAG TPA: hypothetical protein VFD63_01930 [Pyrinomonadaceae bacterium]|nr:hypothetical protein [Pyrinomonadaceae bacterium]
MPGLTEAGVEFDLDAAAILSAFELIALALVLDHYDPAFKE